MRFALTAAVATALVCATFGMVASSALAWTDSDRDSYTVNISPASAPAGQSTTFHVALTNTSSPGSGLASAEILPPFGFRVTGASLPTGASGRVHVFLNIVWLDHLNVPPGGTLAVSVTATAPPRCSWPFGRWFTNANEGGFFSEDLRLDTSSSNLTTPVTCVTATGLKFAGQPNDSLVGSVITGNANNTSGPPVTVDLVDSTGNPVTTTGTPVTIALGNNPANATLSGTLTENTVNGVATFADLKLDKPDNGYTLTASSSGLTGDTSGSFNENDSATPCPANTSCTGTITSGSGQLKVDVSGGTTDTTLTLSVDVGTPMDGPGSDPEADPGCAGYTPPEASADWYEFVVGATDRQKTLTWTVNGTTSDGFQVCFGAPYEFNAQGTDSGLAPAGRLPDGSSGFVGLLQPCSELTAESPCVDGLRTDTDPTTGAESAVAIIEIPPGLTGDPWVAR
jgi:hypothetical protein